MMRYMLGIAAFVAAFVLLYVMGRGPILAAGAGAGEVKVQPVAPATQATLEDPKMKKATFAAGCFWGVEETFRHVSGVVGTRVGYIGGHTDNPTYKQVCTDLTGHAEAVEVTYDPSKVSYAELLDVFWTSHDPTTKDRQGPDLGSQYRSGIFYHDADQEKIAKASLKEVEDSKVFHNKIVTQIVEAGKFYSAEEYHQQYFAKNNGTCHLGTAKVHTKLAEEAKKERETAVAK